METRVVFQHPARRALNPASLWLAAGYVIAFVALGAVAILAVDGLLPVFFVPGRGGTPIRHILLDVATAIFAFTAMMIRTANRKSLSPFHYWYSYALGLIAVGLFGTVIASTFSSALFWAGRAGQWLGGVYILIAAIASVRESKVWGISLEAALHESETRFRSLYEHAAVGIEQLTNDGRLLMVNPALCRMLGYSESELLGRTVMELTHPDDVAREAELREPVLRGERDSFEIEKRYLHRNGSPVWVHAKSSVVKDVAGHPLYRVAIIQDITERKRAEEALRASEERLRQAADLVGLLPYTWEPLSGMVHWDKRLKSLWGLPPDAVINHEVFLAGVHPEDRAHVNERTRDR